MNKISTIFIFLSFLTVNLHLSAQVKITGTIIDGDGGDPLIGVNIIIPGTTIGTTTDFDGNYEINLSSDVNVLEVSYVGYIAQTIEINGRTIIDIAMAADVETLEDVVIVGYGVQRKSDLTGAVSSIKSEDIAKMPFASAAQALQGKAAGVRVTSSSGAPGSEPIVRIRGIGTLNNASPLYVVDGIFLDDISFLSSGDIESIEVLKDASATAIYGSRGANGVMLITTKRSSNTDRTIFNFASTQSLQNLTKRIDLTNGRQFGELVNEISPGTFNNLDVLPDVDWQDEVFEEWQPMQNYHLSAQGGNERHQFYLSGALFQQDGIIAKSDYERISVKFNNTYRAFGDHLELGSNLSLSSIKVQNTANVVSAAYKAWPVNEPLTPEGTFAEVMGSGGNPLAAIEYTNSHDKGLDLIGNIYAQINFLEHFHFKSSFGQTFRHRKRRSFTPEFFVSATQSNPESGLSLTYSDDKQWLWENTLLYANVINEKHRFDILTGYTLQENDKEFLSGSTRNLIGNDEELRFIIAGDSDEERANNDGSQSALLSYLFRINYTLNDKYLLTATFRRDGSSKFGIDDQYGNFGAIALGWNIGRERFITENFSKISRLKLRTSWGVIGNEKINGDDRFSLINSNGADAVFNDDLVQGVVPGLTSNPDLRWESTSQFDVGLEIGLFEDKFTGEVDYFRRTTSDILVQLQTPGHFGNGSFARVTENAAEVLNAGVDLALGYKKRVNNDLSFSIGINSTFLENTVKRLEDNERAFIVSGSLNNGQNVTRTQKDHPIGAFFGFDMIGVYQSTEEIASSPTVEGKTVVPGDLKFRDVNNDGVINTDDRTFIGSSIPDVYAGLTLSLDYKNIDFSVDFQGQWGNEIYNGKKVAQITTTNFEKIRYERWTPSNPSNSEPRVTTGGYNYEVSSYFLEDASFIRIRSIQLGYTIPSNLTSKALLKNARVFISATNAWTLTDYTGYSPELASRVVRTDDVAATINPSSSDLAQGIDLGTYPVSAIYNFGINISF